MNTKSLLILLYTFILFTTFSFGQQLFYQDIIYGGVTTGGFSTGQGSGLGSFSLYIEPGSTIKQAYLFTYRIGYPPNVPITINGSSYLFDTTNVLMQVNHKNPSAIPINLYFQDFTDSLNANITSIFNVTIPSQPNLPINAGYWTIFIYIAYENPILPKVASSIWINDKDFLGNEFYNYHSLIPIDKSNAVSFSLYSDRTPDTIVSEGYFSYLNSNFIGTIGGPDGVNSLWSAGGVKGHFYYQNNSLFGLDDDTPDSLMGGSDGLADISSYLTNNDTTFNFRLTHQKYPNNNPGNTNVNLAQILTYTTPCDTFFATITANDTICLGDSIQLQAAIPIAIGSGQYSWFGAFGGLSDTSISNPKASPPQTTTYIVTITNDSGCVKTEQVKIWVNPLPMPDTLIVINNFCGDSLGSLQVGNIASNTAPYNYILTNLQTTNSNTQIANVFSGLGTGNYSIQITDANGCSFTDTLIITETNNVQANFTANPQSGVAPLNVDFTNTSTGANNFSWTISNENGDTIWEIPVCTGMTVNCGFSYTFDSAGTYQVCLVAFNNIPTCADTICQTIIVEDEIMLTIPNVFTPNGDRSNDNFVIQLTGASLIKSLKAEVFNRWGQLVSSSEFQVQDLKSKIASSLAMTQLTLWDGYTTAAAKVPEGTYFYVISYETIDGEIESKKGSVTLLK